MESKTETNKAQDGNGLKEPLDPVKVVPTNVWSERTLEIEGYRLKLLP